MKKIALLLILTQFSFLSWSQKPLINSVNVIQNGKLIKAKKGKIEIEQQAFTLVFTFSKELKNIGVLTYAEPVEDISQDSFSKASTGGAFSWGNEDKNLVVYGSEWMTYLPYLSQIEHCYDTVYAKGKYLVGEKEINEFRTADGYPNVADFTANDLFLQIIAFDDENGQLTLLQRLAVELNMKAFKPFAPYDVRGKTYEEEAGAFVEGCEGCGNGASFEFSKDGKTINFLLSGSDIFEFGEYEQKGRRISILQTKYSFTVSEDGQTLSNDLYENINYKLSK